MNRCTYYLSAPALPPHWTVEYRGCIHTRGPICACSRRTGLARAAALPGGEPCVRVSPASGPNWRAPGWTSAGDWPFDWGGAFEGRGDVRQHFPSGARAYLRDPLPRTLCDAARFLYDLPRPRGAAGLRHIQVHARSHTHKHTHVKAGYPRALGGRTGLLPRPRGSTTLPGNLPLAWIYFSFYTPGWQVRTPSVKTRPPGNYMIICL